MHDLDKVLARIEEVRKELARLETARDVLAEIYGASGTPKASPAGKSRNGHAKGGFTLRRVADPALAKASPAAPAKTAKRQPAGDDRKKRSAQKKDIRERALAALQSDGPSSSRDLFERLSLKQPERQWLYDALYTLKMAGTIKHGVDGIYAIAAKGKGKAAQAEPATAH